MRPVCPSSAQREQLLMNESKEEALFRKYLAYAIRESYETFARPLNQISSSVSTVAQILARSFEFMNQMMFNNNSQQRHYQPTCQTFQPIKTILVCKVIINKVSYYNKIEVHLMNLDTLGVEIHQWITKTMKVVQHTNNYSKNINETRLARVTSFWYYLFFFLFH